MALQSFRRFLELPTELQTRIWNFALEAAEEEANTLSGMTAQQPTSHVLRPTRIRITFLKPLTAAERPSSTSIWKRPMDPFLDIMSIFRVARLIGLKYWHRHLKSELLRAKPI